MCRPRQPTVRIEPERIPDNPAIPLGYLGRMPQIVPNEPDADSGDDEGPHDYTWKTVLCDCDTNEQAKELSAALRQAGLDSWIQQPIEFGRRYARVLVAADQLEQARAIAAQPDPAGDRRRGEDGSAGVRAAHMSEVRRERPGS